MKGLIRQIRRLIAIVLIVAMVFNILPQTAYANQTATSTVAYESEGCLIIYKEISK